ncbi:hypothetical protein KIN20_016412 [Parelaphostrongylus tenuis]|uniref:Uncharacterized protein n=1 Tax=Parelaphostrongylus tenuis TaxID=148309 RepID=A0AAD5MZR4_PARTN|nr:hypothetical protein KIN20_016412 [Parelaphostrongylus tenuis]
MMADLELLEHQDPMPLMNMSFLVPRTSVSNVHPDRQVPQDNLDLKDHLGTLEHPESKDLTDDLDHQELLDLRDHQDPVELTVSLDNQEHRVRFVQFHPHPDHQDNQESPDHQDLPDLMDVQEAQVFLDHLDHRVIQDKMGHLVIPEHLESLGNLEKMDLEGHAITALHHVLLLDIKYSSVDNSLHL